MYRIYSILDLTWLLVKSAAIGLINAWFFATVVGPRVPRELEVYGNTVALTVGVIWLFFTTSIWVITDGESKRVSEAIEVPDEAKFLREASKRVSPGIWIIYIVATLATLATFDLFHVGEGPVVVFAAALNFILSFVVIVGAAVVLDSDDSLSGAIVVNNASEVSNEWNAKLQARMRIKNR